MLKTRYMFKDEHGQETETRKTYTDDVLEAAPAIDFMFSDFKQHLKSCGYSDQLIKEFSGYHFGNESDTRGN